MFKLLLKPLICTMLGLQLKNNRNWFLFHTAAELKAFAAGKMALEFQLDVN